MRLDTRDPKCIYILNCMSEKWCPFFIIPIYVCHFPHIFENKTYINTRLQNNIFLYIRYRKEENSNLCIIWFYE